MNFKEEKAILYKDFFYCNEENINSNLKRRFFSFIESIIILFNDNENSYFGQFLIQVKREIKLDITWPIATTPIENGFLMYFNPKLILDLSLDEIKALLKHEVYHIIMNHYERELSLKNKYSKEAISVAMDISINQYINNLPAYSLRIENVDFKYKVELKENLTIEQYAKEIQKAIDLRRNHNTSEISEESDNLIDISKAHDIWDSKEFSKDELKNSTNKLSLNAYKGKAPKNLEKMILLMKQKPQIEWSKVLKNMIPCVKNGYKKTITRKDRRMPERLDLRGKLPNNISNILVALDISASMSDEEIEKVLVEILAIVKNKNMNVTVIECDDDIRRVYKLNSAKDIKLRSKKNGATKFLPVFEYIKRNNIKNNIVIYFTDGKGEKELTVNVSGNKVLWVLTDEEEDLSLKKPFGIKIKMKRVKKKEQYISAVQELRDAILEVRETILD